MRCTSSLVYLTIYLLRWTLKPRPLRLHRAPVHLLIKSWTGSRWLTTLKLSQAVQFAKSVNDVLQGPSSANGNGQPSKRSCVSSDDALVGDEIVVNKRAKPDFNEACAKAYKNLRNTGVRLAQNENQGYFFKKYLDLGVTLAYMRYNTVPSIERNNPVLKNRWDETIQIMTRGLGY